ncbi:MAG: hypothetical protein ACYCY0_12585, partial [Acidithiobacillus ferrivorans]
DPLERVTGSLAFGAFARVVWATIKPAQESGDQQRRLIRTKSNIGPDGGGFEYDLTQTTVPGHSDLYASCILWGEALEGSARELAGQIEDEKASGEEKGLSPREEATDFLLDFLADGPKLEKEIRECAGQECIAKRTLDRAKKEMGVVSVRIGKAWGWHLKNWIPGTRADGDQEGHIPIYKKTGNVGTLDDGDPTESPQNQIIAQESQPCHIPDDDTPMDGEV